MLLPARCPGVSCFQLHFANYDILTPGDRPDVLVAMNPAALKANIADLPRGGMLIVNTDEFTKRNLPRSATSQPARGRLAGALHGAPGRDGDADPWRAGGDRAVSKKDAERAKNMFALGPAVVDVPPAAPRAPSGSCGRSSRSKPDLAEANILAFRAGWNYGETTESFAVTYEVAPAPLPAGTYRQITGNPRWPTASWPPGSVTGLPVFLGTYPITPASDILHELSQAQGAWA